MHQTHPKILGYKVRQPIFLKIKNTFGSPIEDKNLKLELINF